MSAHHVKHAITCPSYGNGELAKCTCNAPGASKVQASRMTTGDIVQAADALGMMTPTQAARERTRNLERRRQIAAIATGAEASARPVILGSMDERQREALRQAVEQIAVRDAASMGTLPSASSYPLSTQQPTTSRLMQMWQQIVGTTATDGTPPPESEDTDTDDADVTEAADRYPYNETTLVNAARSISVMVGRVVSIWSTGETSKITRDTGDTFLRVLVAVQRCRACGKYIEVRETEPEVLVTLKPDDPGSVVAAELQIVTAFGTRVRFAFHKHKCDSAPEAMNKLTNADLQALEESLESEIDRIGERLHAIRTEGQTRREKGQTS